MSRRGVIGELEIIDNAINDLRLHQIDLTIVLLLNIDNKLILNVSHVLNISPGYFNLLHILIYGSRD